jgi:hypothetical protein
MDPIASNTKLGEMVGRSSVWVGECKSSEIFQQAYEERRKELTDPIIRDKITRRMEMMVSRGVEVLITKLGSSKVSDSLAIQAVTLGAKSMGLGGFSNRPERPEAPMPTRIEDLAHRLLNMKQGATDVDYVVSKEDDARGQAVPPDRG